MSWFRKPTGAFERKPDGHVRNHAEEEAGAEVLMIAVKRQTGACDVQVDLKTRELFVVYTDRIARHVLPPDTDLSHPTPGEIALLPGNQRTTR
jgi:hypothetical protein